MKKPKRDPAAPKRNLSPYLLYQNAMRDEFKAQKPEMSFGELSKYTSKQYGKLTKEGKDLWKQKAENDRQRFLKEMEVYVPAEGYDSRGDIIKSPEELAVEAKIVPYPKKTSRTKSQRDPRAPKRNASAFIIFQSAMRDKFKTENPDLSFGELAQYTSKKFKALEEKERALWEDRAKQDKERYRREMESYVPNQGYDHTGKLISNKTSGKKSSSAKDPNHPKRARGSFVFFTFDERPKILAENPDTTFTELGNIMGKRWRELDAEARKKYEDLAKEDRARFLEEMKTYKLATEKEREKEVAKQEEEEALKISAGVEASVALPANNQAGMNNGGMNNAQQMFALQQMNFLNQQRSQQPQMPALQGGMPNLMNFPMNQANAMNLLQGGQAGNMNQMNQMQLLQIQNQLNLQNQLMMMNQGQQPGGENNNNNNNNPSV